MATNIVVPALGESVTEATVAKWSKAVGDPVQRDEALLELETDKVTLEVYASASGRLSEIRAPAGATVEVGAVVGVIADGVDAGAVDAGAPAPQLRRPSRPRPHLRLRRRRQHLRSLRHRISWRPRCARSSPN